MEILYEIFHFFVPEKGVFLDCMVGMIMRFRGGLFMLF